MKERANQNPSAGLQESGGQVALQETAGRTSPAKGRMANLELLRCVAMMMVVVLHYLGKGGLLADLEGEINGPQMAAWLLECFCIVAVNVYMFISGYFLCTSAFKPGRLLRLIGQVWVYSVSFGLIGALSGVMAGADFDTHYLLTLLFPVSMGHYWFMTAYVYFYLLLPLAGAAVGRMTKRQLQVVLGFVLTAFCLLKSILPVRFEMDGQGYDCLWYLSVFLAAAYVRRFGCAFLEKKGRGLALYAGCCVLIFGGTLLLREIYLRTGSLGMMMKFCLEYNHILPFLASAGLFGAFSRIKIDGVAAKWINRIAPYTLGVYLLHENIGLRYSWQEWLGAGRAAAAMERGGLTGVGSLFLWTVAAVAAVFACGILVDFARKWLGGRLHRIFLKAGPYRRVMDGIDRRDGIFAAKQSES